MFGAVDTHRVVSFIDIRHRLRVIVDELFHHHKVIQVSMLRTVAVCFSD